MHKSVPLLYSDPLILWVFVFSFDFDFEGIHDDLDPPLPLACCCRFSNKLIPFNKYYRKSSSIQSHTKN